jgi:hypothetical protein
VFGLTRVPSDRASIHRVLWKRVWNLACLRKESSQTRISPRAPLRAFFGRERPNRPAFLSIARFGRWPFGGHERLSWPPRGDIERYEKAGNPISDRTSHDSA